MTATIRPTASVCEILESRRLLSYSAESIVPPVDVHSVKGALSTGSSLMLNGTGLTGEYFSGNNFQTPLVVRLDSTINFRWTAGRPDQVFPKGVFSVQWTGLIEPALTETYTFYSNSNSGTRVIINGTTIVDDFTSRKPSVVSGSIALTAGQQYNIEIEYVSGGKGVPRVQLMWSAPSIAEQLVSSTWLFPAAVSLPTSLALTGTYYEGTNFNKELMTRADPSVNFNWGTGAPDQALPLHTPFSVQWLGQITAPVTGKYTFQTITDDGVRLWVDGVEIIKDWNVHSAQADIGKITLQAGQTYQIRMDYFADGAGHSSAKLLWALPGPHRNLKFVHFVVPAGPAAPLGLAVTNVSPTQLDLTWADTPGETGFILERSSDGGDTFTPVATLGQDVLAYPDTGLTPATTYEYEIVATDAAGASGPSHPITAVTPPGAVTTSATVSGTTATLTWTTAGTPDSFLIERSPDGVTNWTSLATVTTSTYQDTGLAYVTPYYYRVTATDASGNSGPSNVVGITTAPMAPTNVVATTKSATQIDLSWNDVPGETGFIIEGVNQGQAGGSFYQIGSVPAGTTSFPISGLAPNTQYQFRIIAEGPGANSAFSIAIGTTSAANPAFATLTTIFGLTGNGLVYQINTATGATTQIGTLSYGTNAAGRDTYTGNFYYLSTGTSTVSISSWNPNDGANTVINPSVALSGPVAQAAFRADGDMFITTDVGDIYEINSDTGVATHNGTIQVNGSTLATGNGDMAFAPDGTLYDETSSELYSITPAALNAATATTSIVTATDIGPTGTQNLQLAFGQNGILYGTDASGQLYIVNPATAATTPVGSPSGINIGDLASVPLYADLKITQSAGTFVRGTSGAYTLTINNAGPDTTVGPMTVVDTLPAGITYVSGSGTGWTFSVSGQTVTMTYSQNVPPGTSAPVITLNLSVAPSAASSVTNSVTVSTNIFTTNTADNSGTLVTAVSG